MMKMFSKKMKNQKGFTLVELIVVIAIIGILGAIAVPRFGGFRENAAEKADNATMGIIRNAVMITLTNGDITVGAGASESNPGTISVTFTGTDGTPTFTAGTNVTIVGTPLNALLGNDLKPQVVGKTGYTIEITPKGDVSVNYTAAPGGGA